MATFPQGPFLTVERTFAMLDSLARRSYVECVCKTWYRAYWITVKGCGSLVPVGSFGLLPVRIQRRMLLVGEAGWLPNPDGRLANGIGLADSDSRLTDPDSAPADAHIWLAESDSRLSNAVGLADPRARLTDSDGAWANARIRSTNSTVVLSNGIRLADSDGCCTDANIRPASQTC